MYAMEVLQWAQLNSSGCHDFPKATKKGPLIRKKRYCQQMHLGWLLEKLLIDLSAIALGHYYTVHTHKLLHPSFLLQALRKFQVLTASISIELSPRNARPQQTLILFTSLHFRNLILELH